jgi:uncharacterized membrane protein
MIKKKDILSTLILISIACLLLSLPDGGAERRLPDAPRVKAKVLGVDNASLYNTGLIIQGDQYCELEIRRGELRGLTVRGVNRLIGKMEMDKVFTEGDYALVVLDRDVSGAIVQPVTMVDHYRLGLESVLFGGFVLLLILFAGATGFKALLSFVITVLTVWKALVPGLLLGMNPILISFGITVGLTLIILYAVGGFTRKATAAAFGSLAGTSLTAALALIFGNLFKIHGAIMPFSENLLYSGYSHLNLTEIFIACIFIASSGALMDLAMDIASAVEEVVAKKPDIGKRDAVRSGLNVGRAVIGTMTTTLLLAYSGGYLSLLMVFMAQGTPIVNILNLKYVSSEIMYTMIGSIGLVTVAPFTAVAAGLLLANEHSGICSGRASAGGIAQGASEPGASAIKLGCSSLILFK